jgi:hypothetical protein
MKQIILCDAGDYERVSKLCKKYNLGVNIDISTPENNSKEINEIAKCYKGVEICSIHVSFMDLNFSSSDELIREITQKRYEYAYKISRLLKCKNIILPYSYDPRRYSPSLAISLGFWEYFLKNKDKETIFYIENIFDNSLVIINDLINAISFSFNNYNLKMCFDVGYANIFSKIKITKWIEKMNKNIRFVNLYNNDGKNNELNVLDICELARVSMITSPMPLFTFR